MITVITITEPYKFNNSMHTFQNGDTLWRQDSDKHRYYGPAETWSKTWWIHGIPIK